MGSQVIALITGETLEEQRAILGDAINCLERALASDGDLSNVYPLFESAALLIDEGDPENTGYLCAEHVFHECMGEDWRNPFQHRNAERADKLFDSTVSYLQKKGYRSVRKPKVDDIVAYGGFNNQGRFTAEHFGIIRVIETDGAIEVESKFGRGPVLRHFLQAAPYGDYIMYFRKNE